MHTSISSHVTKFINRYHVTYGIYLHWICEMALSSKSSVPELFHLQGSYKLPKHKFGSTERSFRATWCEVYPWLHYDKASDSAFCHLCTRAVSEGKLLASTKCDLHLLAVDIRTGKKRPLHLRDIKPVHATEKLTKLLLCYLSRFVVI